jgi:hypothetical protein
LVDENCSNIGWDFLRRHQTLLIKKKEYLQRGVKLRNYRRVETSIKTLRSWAKITVYKKFLFLSQTKVCIDFKRPLIKKTDGFEKTTV